MEKYNIHNKQLKLAAYDINGDIFGGEKNIDLSDVVVPNSLSNNWYLYGKLVNITGYNKAVILNANKIGVLSKNNETCINGIFPVFIYNIIEPCIGYFWTYKGPFGFLIQRGNVCLFSDKEGRTIALDILKKKYRNNRLFILDFKPPPNSLYMKADMA